MRARYWSHFILIAMVCGLADFGHAAEVEVDHDDHDEEGVAYEEGEGLHVPSEIRDAIGVRTVAASEQSFEVKESITARIIAIGPQILAFARVDPELAERLTTASLTEASLVRVDRSPIDATRHADAIFALPASESLQVGDFVDISISHTLARVTAVPRLALLEAATGTFVYRENGEAFRRQAVQTGKIGTDMVEIVDGLNVGDVVVTQPVEQLWLIELRLTKGGGHSH